VCVTKTAQGFVDEVVSTVPEAAPVVDENFRDYDGELLLHLLVADLRRFAIAAFDAGDFGTSRRLLTVVDQALADGDEALDNAICVSFVEDVGWWDPAMQPFIASWPAGLTAEVERQRGART
jgi:hypothetical protein